MTLYSRFSLRAARAAWAFCGLIAMMLANRAFAADHVMVVMNTVYAHPENNIFGSSSLWEAVHIARGLGFNDPTIPNYTDFQAGKLSGFVRKNISLADMRALMSDLVRNNEAGDRVFIYYGGHGGAGKSGDIYESFIALSDEKVMFSTEFNGYLASLHKKAGSVLVILDACMSGGFSREFASVLAQSDPGSKRSDRDSTSKGGPGSTISLITTTRADEYAWGAKAPGFMNVNIGIDVLNECASNGYYNRWVGTVGGVADLQGWVNCAANLLRFHNAGAEPQHPSIAGDTKFQR